MLISRLEQLSQIKLCKYQNTYQGHGQHEAGQFAFASRNYMKCWYLQAESMRHCFRKGLIMEEIWNKTVKPYMFIFTG